MKEASHCQSCGMPIEDGPYCEHCTSDDGSLQSFDERFQRMSQWMQKQEQSLSREEAETQALAHMATMPAWKDHPKVKAAQA